MEHYYIIINWKTQDICQTGFDVLNCPLTQEVAEWYLKTYCPTATKIQAVELTAEEFAELEKQFPIETELDYDSLKIIYDQWFRPRYLRDKQKGTELRFSFGHPHEMLYQRRRALGYK